MNSLIIRLLHDKFDSKFDSVSNHHIKTIKSIMIKLGVEFDLLTLPRVILCDNKFTFSNERRKSQENLKKFKQILKKLDKLIEASKAVKLKENYRIIKNIVLELMVIDELVEIEYNHECDIYDYDENGKHDGGELFKAEILLSDFIDFFKDVSRELEVDEYYDRYIGGRPTYNAFVVEYINLLIDNRFRLLTQYFSNIKAEALSNDELDEALLLEKKVEQIKSYRTIRVPLRKSRGSAS